jgi:hypothetical protein
MSYSRRKESDDKQKTHPVWRAVGLIMVVLIPIISYAGALVLLDLNSQNRWMIIPADLLAPGADQMLYIKIGLTVIFSMVLYALFMMINFIAYSAFGPDRYGPMDAPPQAYKKRRRRR